MAGVEAYAPCPCGSGEKFKWCCQKVESFADRAQRLYESGQGESAIKILDEGLRKEPGNPWLLTRKAVMQIRQGQAEPAKTTLRQVLAKNPKHLGALVLLTRCVLETEGPVNGAGMFQEVLGKVDDAQRPGLGALARVVAYMLAQARVYPATLKHLRLAADLDGDNTSISSIRNVEASPAISPWLKDDYRLVPAPAQLWGETKKRYDDAVARAGRGLWASAAAAFDLLSASEPGGDADYNLGLCRLWLGDEAGALGPLRRRSKKLGATTEAVDLEVLCQQIEPIHPEDRVEVIQLSWPLRNRDALLASLRAAADVFDDGTEPIEEEAPEAGVVSSFALLDRPRVDKPAEGPIKLDQIPRILGRVSVIGEEEVALETYDDGRVDTLGDRFTALAGHSIAPENPKSVVLGVESRSNLALAWEWLLPEGMTKEGVDGLNAEKQGQILGEVWPETPMPYLNFRTPTQAARDGNAEIPLRAAFAQHERARGLSGQGVDFSGLRERLGIPPEPPIDPETVVIDRLPLARLEAVDPARLDDENLVRYLERARRAMLIQAIEAAGREILARPAILERRLVDSVSLHADLASFADLRGDREAAQGLIAKGRQADSPAERSRNAPLWDMIEVRLKSRTDRPETWVPELAVVMERYSGDPVANQVILMNLVEMGLVQMQPSPDNREDVLLDSRPLQALLAEYGPRVTTASGRLGVSASRPEVWTPGGPASGGGGGGLWTPGSASPAGGGGEKPKLILPGR